jgi:hypothetical protein
MAGQQHATRANSALPLAEEAKGGAPITTVLLNKLLELERMVGRADEMTLRAKLMDAQTDVLRMQAEVIQVLEDMNQLRAQQERCATSALSPVSARAEKAPRAVRLPRLAPKTA